MEGIFVSKCSVMLGRGGEQEGEWGLARNMAHGESLCVFQTIVSLKSTFEAGV